MVSSYGEDLRGGELWSCKWIFASGVVRFVIFLSATSSCALMAATLKTGPSERDLDKESSLTKHPQR